MLKRYCRRYGIWIAIGAVLASLGVASRAAGQADAAEANGATIRILAYNVEFGRSATPEQIGEALKPLNLDIVTFNEVPGGDWTKRVGKVLGMRHHYTGKTSSANHKDKYRSILSRTPLMRPEEHILEGRGWNPASAVHARTRVKGNTVSIYSLHVSGTAHGGSTAAEGTHAQYLMDKVIAKDKADFIIVAGDFNDRVDEPVMDHYKQKGFRLMWDDLGIDVSRQTEHYTWNVLGQGNAGVIDHIVYKADEAVHARDGGILAWEKPLSDHHPVWVELVVPESRVRGGAAAIESSQSLFSEMASEFSARSFLCFQLGFSPEELFIFF